MIWRITLFACILICIIADTTTFSFVVVPPSQASVEEVTSSKITIRWNFTRIVDPTYDVKDYHVEYSSQYPSYEPFVLEKANYPERYYVAKRGRELQPDEGTSERKRSITTLIYPTHMIITVDELEFPDELYGISISRTLRVRNNNSEPHGETKTVTKYVRTKPVPPYPAKIGVGCFRVLERGLPGEKRKVKVYWQPRRSKIDDYLISAISEDLAEAPHDVMVPTKRGSTTFEISYKRHDVVIRKAGTFGEPSQEYVTIGIPSEEDILPPIASLRRWEPRGEFTVLSWEKPEDTDVMNYTIFWLDVKSTRAPGTRILDFVHVDRDTTTFRVKGKYAQLAISVNTESSSSGLQVPFY